MVEYMWVKTCYKCKKIKGIHDFYKSKTSPDGFINKCKECSKKAVRDNYKKNIEYYKKYNKKRAMLPHNVEHRQKYEKTEAGKKAVSRAQVKYRNKFPNAYIAHTLFMVAGRSGVIVNPQSCSECQSSINVQGHHDDYNSPLVVRWLCCKCHNKWHNNNTPLNRV